MKILVINSGSSSIKYQLLDMATESVLVTGLVERIGEAGGVLTARTWPGTGVEKRVRQETTDPGSQCRHEAPDCPAQRPAGRGDP